MSYGDNPVGEQEHDTGQTFGAPPSCMDQPGYDELGSMPPTYLVWGKIAFFCGFLCNAILGLPAAYLSRRYSDQVPPLWANGNVLAAISASRKARNLLIASFVFDVLGLILVGLVFLGSNSNFNNPSRVAASIKTQLQQRLSDSSSPDYQPGVTVTSVVCTHAGTNIDHCVISASNGETQTMTVTISGNGTSYSAR